jgi:hypothetical protein
MTVRSEVRRQDRPGAIEVAKGVGPTHCLTCCATVSGMARREKRSISLPPELAHEIDEAAVADGTTFSAWLADTAAHRLRMHSGRRAIAEWEVEQGPLTPEELADGLARARALLGRPVTERPVQRTA